jgi:hypothetical protein
MLQVACEGGSTRAIYIPSWGFNVNTNMKTTTVFGCARRDKRHEWRSSLHRDDTADAAYSQDRHCGLETVTAQVRVE